MKNSLITNADYDFIIRSSANVSYNKLSKVQSHSIAKVDIFLKLLPASSYHLCVNREALLHQTYHVMILMKD